MTIIQDLGERLGNRLLIKREDLIPFSFGGNKARKAALFFEEIDQSGSDCVVTYGSGSSNHCRVVANMCAQRGLDCLIISPAEASKPTFNTYLMEQFGAKIQIVPVDLVSSEIDATLSELKSSGRKPFFIPGGGHGNTGTKAYVQCYDEILRFEKENGLRFDYIFHASGTGTTQAGLVCGQLMHGGSQRIIGVSIARRCPYGRDVVLQSILDYLPSCNEEQIGRHTHFIDSYISGGYGASDAGVEAVIRRVMSEYGIPLDPTYTGKAFYGMEEIIKSEGIAQKNILFIHTGGTPLYFDYLRGKN